ncbi:hypothetical protein HO133_003570 [Letharia lupina]|uniref:Uncharacterized protein n=1 Tax=Letharia lupina TaxID=560253 RepID=A0A8H6CAB2_9LECA|nr:uncharacterized protein HO133_003570 [Letharia lupina]KAF6219745.1 hypothetical protein HO133_003570 [Letharia lupina]
MTSNAKDIKKLLGNRYEPHHSPPSDFKIEWEKSEDFHHDLKTQMEALEKRIESLKKEETRQRSPTTSVSYIHPRITSYNALFDEISHPPCRGEAVVCLVQEICAIAMALQGLKNEEGELKEKNGVAEGSGQLKS